MSSGSEAPSSGSANRFERARAVTAPHVPQRSTAAGSGSNTATKPAAAARSRTPATPVPSFDGVAPPRWPSSSFESSGPGSHVPAATGSRNFRARRRRPKRRRGSDDPPHPPSLSPHSVLHSSAHPPYVPVSTDVETSATIAAWEAVRRSTSVPRPTSLRGTTMTEVHGTCDERFTAMRELLAANLASGADLGASVAVTLEVSPSSTCGAAGPTPPRPCHGRRTRSPTCGRPPRR